MVSADNESRRQEEVRRARKGLLRTAITWTPLFAGAFGGALFFVFDELTGGDRGTWFLVGLLLFVSTLFGFLGLQALWDLFSEPTSVEGAVVRRWSRSDSLVMRSHYIRLTDRKIFRIQRLWHGDPREGDRVRVDYYPHSAQVIRLAILPPEEAPPPDDATPAEQPVAATPRARRTARKERVQRPEQ
jgi:hypothetical protein